MSSMIDFQILHLKCNIFGRVFELSAADNFDSYEFAKKIMTDKSIAWIYETDDCQDWCDGEFLYSELKSGLDFKKGKTLDTYLLHFAGYLYKYWMNTKGTDRAEIYKILPLQRLEASFGFYHTQGWEYIIEDSIQAYKNKSYVI